MGPKGGKKMKESRVKENIMFSAIVLGHIAKFVDVAIRLAEFLSGIM